MTDNEIIGHVMDRSLIMPDRLRNLMRSVHRTAQRQFDDAGAPTIGCAVVKR